MRLRTFHAKSLADAMLLVREHLGDEAIIVSTHEAEGSEGARVIAAIEQEDDALDLEERAGLEEAITAALESHGAPPELTDRIVMESSMIEETDPARALAHALATVFDFSPIDVTETNARFALIGPPGTGKTVTCAKLAAQRALHKADTDPDGPLDNAAATVLVATDTRRLGAGDQLRLYADRLGASVAEAGDGGDMRAILSETPEGTMVVVDTAGTNPYDLEEVAALVDVTEAGALEKILVLGAGRDHEEAADLATAFRPVRPSRLLITGFDIARRLGAMLAAAHAADLKLCNISRSPAIGEPMEPLTAEALARLLMAHGGSAYASQRARSASRSPS